MCRGPWDEGGRFQENDDMRAGSPFPFPRPRSPLPACLPKGCQQANQRYNLVSVFVILMLYDAFLETLWFRFSMQRNCNVSRKGRPWFWISGDSGSLPLWRFLHLCRGNLFAPRQLVGFRTVQYQVNASSQADAFYTVSHWSGASMHFRSVHRLVRWVENDVKVTGLEKPEGREKGEASR